jgi:hypothetical protein
MARTTFEIQENDGLWLSWKTGARWRRLRTPFATRADVVLAINKLLTLRRAANRSRIRKMSPQRTLKGIAPHVERRKAKQ